MTWILTQVRKASGITILQKRKRSVTHWESAIELNLETKTIAQSEMKMTQKNVRKCVGSYFYLKKTHTHRQENRFREIYKSSLNTPIRLAL